MTSPELIDIPPDKRIEPSILTDLAFDDDTRNTTQPSSHRVLSATLLVSVLVHAMVLLMAAYAAKPDRQQAERTVARPSIQIHFQPTPQIQAESQQQSVATEPAPVPVPPDRLAPAEENQVVETVEPVQPSAEPGSGLTEILAESTAAPAQRALPTLTDLRTAARNHSNQDRQRRAFHPDCLVRDRRNTYLDCGAEEPFDFASAEQNATTVYFTPMLPDQPANDREELTSTGARVKAAIEMFDSQLGTTQTRKRIMHVP